MSDVTLTPQEADRLRQILDAHNAKNPQSNKEFDLANPPVKPYRHQEYPACMRHHGDMKEIQVKSAEEEAAKEAEGWTREPLPPAAEPELSLELTGSEAEMLAKFRAKKNKAA